MVNKIDITEFLKLANDFPVVDVRSPGEFEQGHIPGAINLPLFDDGERAAIGKTFKESGRKTAILKGLELVGPKMSKAVKEASKKARENSILVHCWRGGMRSESMAWLYSFYGLNVSLLVGGYKAFRKAIQKAWESDSRILILSGKTGTGKTEILEALEKKGQQVLNLEGIAHHKGSAFGSLGELPQPTTEQFENDLFEKWRTFDLSKVIWMEDESKSIGRAVIPDTLFRKMRESLVVNLDMGKPLRIQRLIGDYANFPQSELENALLKIDRRLGGQNTKEAIAAVYEGNFEKAIDISLVYYDKTYMHGVGKRDYAKVFTLDTDTLDANENADIILDFCVERKLI
nr:tRNA 2-selenouridine(34) synthase MnmH [Bacteroidota bacterium]